MGLYEKLKLTGPGPEIATLNFVEVHQPVEKLPCALFCPRPAAKYDVSVVFWPYFRALLETRSDRQPLFQQAETFYDVGCIAFSLRSSAYLIPSASR